jgi:hypothetical protein
MFNYFFPLNIKRTAEIEVAFKTNNYEASY